MTKLRITGDIKMTKVWKTDIKMTKVGKSDIKITIVGLI